MEKCKLLFSLDQLFLDIIAPLFLTTKLWFQKIRKEKHLHNKENDEQFDKDYEPESPANSHAPETIIVEEEYLLQESQFNLRNIDAD